MRKFPQPIILLCVLMPFFISCVFDEIQRDPRKIANLVVKSLAQGDFSEVKEYATPLALAIIDDENDDMTSNQLNFFRGMNITFKDIINVHDENRVKYAYYILSKNGCSYRVRISLIEENGKWYFNYIQF